VRVKQLLTQRGVAYEEVNLSKDPEGRAELVERTGMLSFPQVVIGDEVIGGFRETLEADRSGRLRELLAA
jgi:glutaredoxin 3